MGEVVVSVSMRRKEMLLGDDYSGKGEIGLRGDSQKEKARVDISGGVGKPRNSW